MPSVPVKTKKETITVGVAFRLSAKQMLQMFYVLMNLNLHDVLLLSLILSFIQLRPLGVVQAAVLVADSLLQ